MTHLIIAYHVSLVTAQTNYCNNNLLILDLKLLNKTMKLYYFHALKALLDSLGKIKIYYGMFRVKMQLSEKRSITSRKIKYWKDFFRQNYSSSTLINKKKRVH